MEVFRNLFDKKRKARVAFWDLIEKSEERLRRLDTETEARWGLKAGSRHFDPQAGLLHFSTPREGLISAPAQVLGTLSHGRPIWRWAWQSNSLPAPLTRTAWKVKAHGEAQNMERLKSSGFACTPVEAWGLVALACLLGGANGAVAEQTDQGLVFLAYKLPEVTSLRSEHLGASPGIDG